MTAPRGHVDLGKYTEKWYKSIVKYKTAFYSFYLPIAAAMYMVSWWHFHCFLSGTLGQEGIYCVTV